MRYGLSLLVCFAMSVCAHAAAPVKTCIDTPNGPVCMVAEKDVVTQSDKSVCSSCSGTTSTQVSKTKQVGPIRQFFRNVFGRR